MGNPHLPWGVNQPIPNLDIYQWMEAELVVGDASRPSLNATGVAFPGSPFIGIGFTDDIGWTHTNNTIKNADLYELQLTSDGTGYVFGGTTRPLSVRQDQIKCARPTDRSPPRASPSPAPCMGRSSPAAPITARWPSRAGLNTRSVVTQVLGHAERARPRRVRPGEQRVQMPFFNVIFADRRRVMYLFGGRQPVRNGGTFADYAGILDGSDPLCCGSVPSIGRRCPRPSTLPAVSFQNSTIRPGPRPSPAPFSRPTIRPGSLPS